MESVIETKVPTKTFKEVHEELEMECTFLTKNHPVAEFKTKSDFLFNAGFHNSIATRLYGAVADSVDIVKDITHRYKGEHKFILEPQLERVCEKYNLYVRDVSLFVGDIPEKNIKDIMNFQIYTSDLPEGFITLAQEIGEELVKWSPDSMRGLRLKEGIAACCSPLPNKISLNTIGEIEIAMRRIRAGRLYRESILEIAAVESLFSPVAFSESKERILTAPPESRARFQVNLDPIVLCNTKHNGRIIVTAWGDESNDELVANQNRN